jgi:hypothetical protein
MNQETPIAIQLTAFTQAICEVLTVPYAEFQIMRELLDVKGIVSTADFYVARKDFPQSDFQAISSELNKRALLKVRQIIQQMTGTERVQ